MQNARFLARQLPDLMLKAVRAREEFDSVPAGEIASWVPVEEARAEVHSTLRALRINILREVMGEGGLLEAEDVVGLCP